MFLDLELVIMHEHGSSFLKVKLIILHQNSYFTGFLYVRTRVSCGASKVTTDRYSCPNLA